MLMYTDSCGAIEGCGRVEQVRPRFLSLASID